MTTPTPSPPAPVNDADIYGEPFVSELSKQSDFLRGRFWNRTPETRPEATPADFWVLAGGLAGGLSIDLALRRPPSIATALAIGVLSLMLLFSGRLKTRGARLLVALAPVFGVWTMFRASPWLIPLDLVAALALLVVGASIGQHGQVGAQTLRSLGTHLLRLPGHVGSALPFGWQGVAGYGATAPGSDRVRSVAIGLAMGIPLMMVLGSLLASGDAVFSEMFFGSDFLPQLPGRIVIVLLAATFSVGLLRSASVRQETDRTMSKWFGAVETAVVLLCIVGLYIAYVASQVVAELAGTERFVADGRATSEWARSGFFHLLAVSVITLAVLVLLRSVTEWKSPREERWFARLAQGAVVLTLVITAISLRRTIFYITEFGLTMLRLYSTLFALWIGLVFVAFGFRLRGVGGSRQWFASVVGGSGLALLLMLNIVNVESGVSRWNANQSHQLNFNADFMVHDMSTDVIPTLIADLPELPQSLRQETVEKLCAMDLPDRTYGLSWNGSTAQARKSLIRLCG